MEFDQRPAPCMTCEFRKVCASQALACESYIVYHNGRNDFTKYKREPSRIDFLRAHEEINVHDCYRAILEIRRAARARGELPSIADISAALKVDRIAVLELLERYKRKQGMTGSVASDEP
ncbi:MAG: hypothetical protein ACRC2H_04515 [Silanimonas sp.]